jgi:hypothetical protein
VKSRSIKRRAWHQSQENRTDDHRERECVACERVGALAVARAEGAGDRRRDAAAHAACAGMLHEHNPGKCERHAGEHVGAERAEEQAVEGDHARDRQQVKHVRCRKAQKRRENRRFEKHARSRGDGPRRRAGLG